MKFGGLVRFYREHRLERDELTKWFTYRDGQGAPNRTA
jgi:hypothetical protein